MQVRSSIHQRKGNSSYSLLGFFTKFLIEDFLVFVELVEPNKVMKRSLIIKVFKVGVGSQRNDLIDEFFSLGVNLS